jgi:hypothetical protein
MLCHVKTKLPCCLAAAGVLAYAVLVLLQVVAVQNQVNGQGMVMGQAFGVAPAGAQVVMQAAGK